MRDIKCFRIFVFTGHYQHSGAKIGIKDCSKPVSSTIVGFPIKLLWKKNQTEVTEG